MKRSRNLMDWITRKLKLIKKTKYKFIVFTYNNYLGNKTMNNQ